MRSLSLGAFYDGENNIETCWQVFIVWLFYFGCGRAGHFLPSSFEALEKCFSGVFPKTNLGLVFWGNVPVSSLGMFRGLFGEDVYLKITE